MLKTESREVTSQIVHVVGATCENCDKVLELKWGASIIGTVPAHQLVANILALTMHGQYDGYFHGPDRIIMFCKECADRLCNAFPCLRRAIEDPLVEQID